MWSCEITAVSRRLAASFEVTGSEGMGGDIAFLHRPVAAGGRRWQAVVKPTMPCQRSRRIAASPQANTRPTGIPAYLLAAIGPGSGAAPAVYAAVGLIGVS